MFKDVRFVEPEFVGAQQDFGKIYHATALAILFVGAINLQHSAHKRIGSFLNVAGAQAFVFLCVDVPLRLFMRPFVFVEVERLVNAFDQAQLVVAVQNLEILWQVSVLPMGFEQAMGQPVESAHPHGAAVDVLIVLIEQFIQPAAHFARSFVGKSHRHNRIGRHLLHLNQPGNTVHQHTGLTAARTGEDQLVGCWRRYGFALFVVELIEEEGNVHNLSQ